MSCQDLIDKNGDLHCPDDLCQGSRTLCGMERGFDFGLDAEDDICDDWDEE